MREKEREGTGAAGAAGAPGRPEIGEVVQLRIAPATPEDPGLRPVLVVAFSGWQIQGILFCGPADWTRSAWLQRVGQHPTAWEPYVWLPDIGQPGDYPGEWKRRSGGSGGAGVPQLPAARSRRLA